MQVETLKVYCWTPEELYPPYVQRDADSGLLFCRKGALPKCVDSSIFVPFPVTKSCTNISNVLQQELLNSVYTHPTFPRLIRTPPLLLVLSALPNEVAAEELSTKIKFMESIGRKSDSEKQQLSELRAQQLTTQARLQLAGFGKQWKPYISSTELLLTYTDIWMTLLCTQAPHNKDPTAWIKMQTGLKESCKVQLSIMKLALADELEKLPRVQAFIDAGTQAEHVKRLSREEAERVLDIETIQTLRHLDVHWQSQHISILEEHILAHLEVLAPEWPLFRCRLELLPLTSTDCYQYLNSLVSYVNGVCHHKNAIVLGSFCEEDIPDFREEADRLSYPSAVIYVRLLSFLYVASDCEEKVEEEVEGERDMDTN